MVPCIPRLPEPSSVSPALTLSRLIISRPRAPERVLRPFPTVTSVNGWVDYADATEVLWSVIVEYNTQSP